MTKKEERKTEILKMLVQSPRRWSELRKHLDVSEATLGTYLKELVEDGLVNKDETGGKKTIYEVDRDNLREEGYLERVKQRLELENQLIEELDSQGLFDGDLDTRGMQRLLQKDSTKELLEGLPIELNSDNLSDWDTFEALEVILELVLSDQKDDVTLDFGVGLIQDKDKLKRETDI